MVETPGIYGDFPPSQKTIALDRALYGQLIRYFRIQAECDADAKFLLEELLKNNKHPNFTKSLKS